MALVGAFYALQRLFTAAGQTGTDLTNFNAAFGVTTQMLQEYSYAAQQVGVSNEEMAGTFKGLQASMTKALMGQGAPEGLKVMSETLRKAFGDAEITDADLAKFAERPDLLLQKLQKYAQVEKNIGFRNQVLKSFGISDGMLAALARNAFTPEALSKAPKYGTGEVKALDDVRRQWANIGTQLEMGVGRLSAKFGPTMTKDISEIVTSVIKLADAFGRLAEATKFLETISLSIQGWKEIFEMLISMADITAGFFSGDEKKKESAIDKASGFFSEIPGIMKLMAQDLVGVEVVKNAPKSEPFIQVLDGKQKPKEEKIDRSEPFLIFPKTVTPTPREVGANPGITTAPQQQGATNINNNNVNQTLNFQDGADPSRTATSVKKATLDAVGSSAARVGGR